ncbi:MAG TPA: guanitoxin biosynthesis heme-dependent pre-guanitoxin N-hydroxylase GntA [Cyclobacteriaceae bacterium]|nr:guanitoxin biosynthesis heme-dependent pre-guanitoxin N-hydroxylase GntA [Cyclobacteriaceae bacterium]
MNTQASTIIESYFNFIEEKGFPCIAAKAALAGNTIKCYVAEHMACPESDFEILRFLYSFVDTLRQTGGGQYLSAVALFKKPHFDNEEFFDKIFWQRLQAISDLDAQHHGYDRRVDNDPTSAHFSFSIREEAFYIIGLHPASGRKARRFSFPAIVFNPHSQFVSLRERDKYESMRTAVRKRDIKYSGSVNPMLADFGESSEVYQYSGLQYDKNWKCPFRPKHKDAKYNSST